MSGAILAGGRSRRMGTDKAFLTLAGQTLLDRQLALFRGLFAEVLVAANDLERCARPGIRVVPDAYPERASLVGIYSALRAASEPWCFVAACDMPFLEPSLIRYLEGFTGGAEAVVPLWRERPEPLHAWYSKDCLPTLTARIDAGTYRLGDLLPHLRVRTVPVEGTAWAARAETIFWNLNTPDDLERARRMTPVGGTLT
ncbi:MAG: molybdenum cofactor guanylyltransferase [Planctomycetes bacterium]|nr:molybdenum cofactor guanylyltransferase [Planctomycetota bacterium]